MEEGIVSVLGNKPKLSDFKIFQLANDFIYNEELARLGGVISTFKPPSSADFKMKFGSDEISLLITEDLLEKYPELAEQNFIIGLEFFKTELFDGFKYRHEIFQSIKDDWKNFAKRCQWEYVALVKFESQVFMISGEKETRIQYPPKNNEQDLFQLLVMADKVKHFVHLSELGEDLEDCTPKKEVYRRIRNYFVNNFYNCPVLFTI